jgi:hypothetical protein
MGLGLLAIAAASLGASAAGAADEPSSLDAAWSATDHSNGGHLHWRPSRSSHAPQPIDGTGTVGSARAAVSGSSALTKPVAPPRDVQLVSHDEPLHRATDGVHRDSNVVPVQRLTAAEPLVNPFADEPTDMKPKKGNAKSDAKPTAPLLPGPANESELLEPSVPAPLKSSARDSAPAKLPGSDPFAPDVPKTEPKTDRDAVPPPPPPPGNDVNSQKTPAIPPATIIPAPNPSGQEPNTTTGKTACDNERAALRKNTVNTVTLDIRPKLTGTDVLPGECTLGDAQFVPRTWDCITYTWKASALCHKPLYFEEVALERYGHSRGPILDPLVSAAHFFVTVPLLPYEMGVEPPCECEYTLGYYRPGSCAPWIIDGIPISLRGMALECTAATGAGFAIP